MSTTTIRLTEELKARIARVAERNGTTPHGFILGALEEKVDEAERRRDFVDEAERRWQTFLADGQVVAWEDMREYLTRRARGESPALPSKKTFGHEP